MGATPDDARPRPTCCLMTSLIEDGKAEQTVEMLSPHSVRHSNAGKFVGY